LAVLLAVAEYYRLLHERGYASLPSIEQMAQSAQVRGIDISDAIKHLIGLGLVAVKPGAGARRNEYLMCLPKRLVAALATAGAAEDDAPF
jgi:DNA-binding transcriptional regulator YhcF (GntR family)